MVIPGGPIAREPAQRLAREELSKAIYHQASVPGEIIHALESLLARIFGGASRAFPGGWWTLVALAALVAGAAAALALRTGPLARSARRAAPVREAGDRPLTARQYRAAAEEAAAGGDYSTAVVQRLRAIAASCTERRVLVPDAGRTADELAAQAGPRFPGQAARLGAAARLFDQIRYGDGAGTREDYERLRDLDSTLGTLTPETAPGSSTGTATPA